LFAGVFVGRLVVAGGLRRRGCGNPGFAPPGFPPQLPPRGFVAGPVWLRF
jgi:hypothetical protein